MIGGDPAYYIVAAIYKVYRAIGADLHIEWMSNLSCGGRAKVAGIAGGTGACIGVDDTGIVDHADAEIVGIAEIDIARGIDADAV